MSDPDVRPEDALQVAQRALAKANRLDELEERIRELEEDQAKMNLRLSAVDGDRPYDDLNRHEKIGMVREYCFERATSDRGRTFYYDDIREGCFDGEPYPKTCYDLMKWAAEAEGFEYQEPKNGQYRLVVHPDVTRQKWAFYSVNKARSEEVHSR